MKKHASVLALALMMSAFAGSMAQAADLAPPPPPQIRPAVSDWTGPYLGAVLGGTCKEGDMYWHRDTDRNGSIDQVLGGFPVNGCGAIGGVVGGFNYQMDNIVFGVEGDWQWGGKTGEYASINDTTNPTAGNEEDYFKIKWEASLRARLGFLTTDKTLLYATGGISWMRGELGTTAPGKAAFRETHTGYIIGGGIEHALTENIHVRAEYLFSSYKSKFYGTFCSAASCSGVPTDVKYGPDQHTFRLGVTWNFPVSQW